MTKQALRQRLLRRLRQQAGKLRLAKSLAIAKRLQRLPLYRTARVLMCYVAFDGEVETRPIIQQALADGKRVAVPITLAGRKKLIAVEIVDPDRDLTRVGPYGIIEPKNEPRRRLRPEKLDLILVPGLAFDARGQRLGRGMGYFDRFLETVPASVPRVGLAFRFQVVKALPWESHDQPVSRVVTD